MWQDRMRAERRCVWCGWPTWDLYTLCVRHAMQARLRTRARLSSR